MTIEQQNLIDSLRQQAASAYDKFGCLPSSPSFNSPIITKSIQNISKRIQILNKGLDLALEKV